MFPTKIEHKIMLIVAFLFIVAAMPYNTGSSESSKIDEPPIQESTKKISQKAKIFDKIVYGKASWYGDRFHGRRTANGEYYNMHTLSAAHKKLAFDSIVKVTNLINGESVVVRINDRGPYIRGRNIDLSFLAAKHLGMVGDGVVPVKMEIVLNKKPFSYRADYPKLN